MASGWAQDGAVDAQIQDSINDEIARVRRRLEEGGESLEECEECGEPIPLARRLAMPMPEYGSASNASRKRTEATKPSASITAGTANPAS